MSQARIIINVSNEDHAHANGLSGTWVVNAKKPNEDFGVLVVFPVPEIQGVGDRRKTVHWLKASPLAMDIVGLRSDACAHAPGSPGTKEKWGLLLCEAEPDVPKELLQAQEVEIEYLNENPPDYKSRKDNKSGAIVQIDVSPLEVQQKKVELSERVQSLRRSFEGQCRKMVAKAEVIRARENLSREDARLISEADSIYAGPETGRANINEIH